MPPAPPPPKTNPPGQWKGAVDITTVPAEDPAPKNSHWVSTITAAGGVVKKDGKNHSLQVTGVYFWGRSSGRYRGWPSFWG